MLVPSRGERLLEVRGAEVEHVEPVGGEGDGPLDLKLRPGGRSGGGVGVRLPVEAHELHAEVGRQPGDAALPRPQSVAAEHLRALLGGPLHREAQALGEEVDLGGGAAAALDVANELELRVGAAHGGLRVGGLIAGHGGVQLQAQEGVHDVGRPARAAQGRGKGGGTRGGGLHESRREVPEKRVLELVAVLLAGDAVGRDLGEHGVGRAHGCKEARWEDVVVLGFVRHLLEEVAQRACDSGRGAGRKVAGCGLARGLAQLRDGPDALQGCVHVADVVVPVGEPGREGRAGRGQRRARQVLDEHHLLASSCELGGRPHQSHDCAFREGGRGQGCARLEDPGPALLAQQLLLSRRHSCQAFQGRPEGVG
mmetsp:Transcript_4807/g.20594  ORF Transcript_4807/g.20594 Transcript_4807/m.20594 type:complete len:367 (+) Transcript_4807:1757-2857(+)